MSAIDRLTEQEVLSVRRRMSQLDIATQDAFGQTEPLKDGILGSAVFRQYTSAGGIYKYKTIDQVAANLFYGIALAHAFENGNKRTALLSMLALLEKNRVYLINTTEDDLYEMARSVAAHDIPIANNAKRNADTEAAAVASWLRSRIRPKVLGDSAMQFKELKEQLEAFGCEFDKPDSNFVKIHHGQWMVKTGYPRAGFEVQVMEVKRIRRALRLDEAQGIDSAVFYNLDQTVDKFVNKYRDLMRRLADL
ncbi:MAG: type II toxin-antitoxin system death-on-curing family toxin [Pseudoxanthomonas sp.]